ncbi:MAG: glycosyltransferase family 4 protein, partial [candidate division Zixibacteria bacterium]|nr:glycosyltransferase family 4 protein [candidate division Zixibacteria bacterium]
GDGPGYKKIAGKATANVTMMGYQPTSIMRRYMQRAKAFIFAAQEDFGIVPIEAQACGTPVIAFGKGGILDTVIENETGIFFHKQDTTSIIDAVDRFEQKEQDENEDNFNPVRIRQNAERFSNERFLEKFKSFVDSALLEHNHNINKPLEEITTPVNRLKAYKESIEKEKNRKLVLK